MRWLTSKRFVAAVVAIELAYTAAAIARAANWDSFLIGDCPYYAATVESLVCDGDWNLANQLHGEIEEHNSFFAMGIDGRIVPKHSVLMPILSIPFYLLCGKAGLLLFNLVQLLALLVGLSLLAGGGPEGRWLSLAAYLSTPFLAYTYNYAPDLLATALFVWAFVLALARRPVAAGACAGLAIWAKVYLALLLTPIALILWEQGWRPIASFVAIALFCLAPMLAIHAHLFGSPFLTGYDREAYLSADGLTTAEHYSRFNQPLVAGLGNLLFDSKIGMLRTAPLWFLWPLGVWLGWREAGARRKILALTAALVLNLALFAAYDEWHASFFGNRFLFPAIAAGFALQYPLWLIATTRIGNGSDKPQQPSTI